MEKSSRDKEYLSVVFQAINMFVIAPIAYGGVVYFMIESQQVAKSPNLLLQYGLLALSIVFIFLFLPVITKAMYRGKTAGAIGRTPVQTVFVIRMAVVESAFLFGLVYFFITRHVSPIVYFYVIGAIGILMHWPTRERFDAIANQLEAK